MNELPKRKTNRLSGYEYSQNGAYFVTICAKDRREWFGRIVGDGLARPAYVELSEYGEIVEQELQQLTIHYPDVMVDRYIIMPNHIHVITIIAGAWIVEPDITGRASPSPTLGNIVGGFKSGVSRRCGFSPWQRSFYDHIIRNEQDFNRIAEYIDNNPETWVQDRFFGGTKV